VVVAAGPGRGLLIELNGDELAAQEADPLLLGLLAAEFQDAGVPALHGAAYLPVKSLGISQFLSLHRDGHGAQLQGELDDVHGRIGKAAPTLANRPAVMEL
jgi:hypothetical protein